LEEPTGLSPRNRSSAEDLVKVVRVASTYPEISQFTTQSRNLIDVAGRQREFHNTNRLVGAPGWEILLSKTGYTREAGRCLVMRLQSASRTVLVVLLGASAKSQRMLDALNVRRWLSGEEPIVREVADITPRPKLIKAKFSRSTQKRRGKVRL